MYFMKSETKGLVTKVFYFLDLFDGFQRTLSAQFFLFDCMLQHINLKIGSIMYNFAHSLCSFVTFVPIYNSCRINPRIRIRIREDFFSENEQPCLYGYQRDQSIEFLVPQANNQKPRVKGCAMLGTFHPVTAEIFRKSRNLTRGKFWPILLELD